MVKTYRYIGHAKNNPRVWKAKNKTTLIKRIKKETPVFAKGKTTSDFIEV